MERIIYYYIYVVFMRISQTLVKALKIKRLILVRKLVTTLVIIPFPKRIKFMYVVAVITIVVTELEVIKNISSF